MQSYIITLTYSRLRRKKPWRLLTLSWGDFNFCVSGGPPQGPRRGSANVTGLVSPRFLLTFTWWGCYGLSFWHKPTELAHSFLFISCVCFCLYGPFNCISSINSPDNSPLSHCSSGLISAVLVKSIMYLCMKVSFNPDNSPLWLTGLTAPSNFQLYISLCKSPSTLI